MSLSDRYPALAAMSREPAAIRVEILQFDERVRYAFSGNWITAYDGRLVTLADNLVAAAIAEPNVRAVRVWARPTYDSRDSAPPFALAHLFDMSWRRPGWEKIDVHQ